MNKLFMLSIQRTVLLAINTLFLIFLTSCSSNHAKPLTNWQTINGRDEGVATQRIALYRVKVPMHWQRQDPSLDESIADTKKSICEFFIKDGQETIRIAIHSFPYPNFESRIPPQAQIARWKRQFNNLDPSQISLHACSQGGFHGLCLEAQGTMHDRSTAVLGWSMQLAADYYRQLSWEDCFMNRQKRADYTIKAVGSPALMHQHRQAIIAFARSFELIEELPSPL